jgi:hypothetical protein
MSTVFVGIDSSTCWAIHLNFAHDAGNLNEHDGGVFVRSLQNRAYSRVLQGQ